MPALIRLLLLLALGGVWLVSPAVAAPERSLYYCSRTAVQESSKFLNDTALALDVCLARLSRVQILSGALVEDALTVCLKSFRKLENSDPNKTPKGRMSAKILKKCDPASSATIDHTLEDVLGPGAGVAEPLHVSRLGPWCRNFGGDGSIESVQEWIDCLAASQYCTAAAYTAARHPRTLEWFTALRPLLESLPVVPSEAIVALDAASRTVDGAALDGEIDLRCGRNDTVATGQLASLAAGDDGMLRHGAALAYLDSGDGTITDLNTGLVWEKKVGLDGLANTGVPQDADNQMSWFGALQHVEAMNLQGFAGHSDWRLPNIRELRSIVDYERLNPAASPSFHQQASCMLQCDALLDPGCSCTATGDYWSSTSMMSPAMSGLVPSAWYVSFANGSWAPQDKATPLYVRAVRSGW